MGSPTARGARAAARRRSVPAGHYELGVDGCAAARRRSRRGRSRRPKPALKAIQRWILHEILDRIPAHDAAHGFVRGRSARTHAALHAGRATVVRLDLEDFFACVTAHACTAIFRTAGYPEAVAHA